MIMKKTILKIILIIIAVLSVIGIVFGIILHNNKINASNVNEIVIFQPVRRGEISQNSTAGCRRST